MGLDQIPIMSINVISNPTFLSIDKTPSISYLSSFKRSAFDTEKHLACAKVVFSIQSFYTEYITWGAEQLFNCSIPGILSPRRSVFLQD